MANKRNVGRFVAEAVNQKKKELWDRIFNGENPEMYSNNATFTCYFCDEKANRQTCYIICDEEAIDGCGEGYLMDRECLRHMKTFVEWHGQEFSIN